MNSSAAYLQQRDPWPPNAHCGKLRRLCRECGNPILPSLLGWSDSNAVDGFWVNRLGIRFTAELFTERRSG